MYKVYIYLPCNINFFDLTLVPFHKYLISSKSIKDFFRNQYIMLIDSQEYELLSALEDFIKCFEPERELNENIDNYLNCTVKINQNFNLEIHIFDLDYGEMKRTVRVEIEYNDTKISFGDSIIPFTKNDVVDFINKNIIIKSIKEDILAVLDKVWVDFENDTVIEQNSEYYKLKIIFYKI